MPIGECKTDIANRVAMSRKKRLPRVTALTSYMQQNEVEAMGVVDTVRYYYSGSWLEYRITRASALIRRSIKKHTIALIAKAYVIDRRADGKRMMWERKIKFIIEKVTTMTAGGS